MGQEIGKIAYNDELRDARMAGLSGRQVELVKGCYHSYRKSLNSGETMTTKALSKLLNIGEAQAQIVLDFADVDSDGSLSEYDFVCLVSLFTSADMKQKLGNFFHMFDVDNSHLISKNELGELVKCVLSINKDGGPVDPSALQQKMLEIRLRCAGDELTKNEFIQLAREDIEIKNALVKIGVLSNEESDMPPEDIEAELLRGNSDDLEEAEQIRMQRDGMVTENNGDDDFFMAVKPFEGVVRNGVPSDFDAAAVDLSAPSAWLELNYVHGYRCHDTRNNIKAISKDRIVFHAAAVGISMDLRTGKQSFNFSHTDDIVSLAVRAGNPAVVFTGQLGKTPTIVGWDANTCQTICVIQGQLANGVSQLACSPDGKFLAGMGMNDEHHIAIYDLSNLASPTLLTHRKGIREVPFAMTFSPDSKSIYVAGQRDLYSVAFNATGVSFKKVSGVGKKQVVMTLERVGNEVVCGADDGRLLVILGGLVARTLDAHSASVAALAPGPNSTGCFSGGADCSVIFWVGWEKKKVWTLGSLGLSLNNARVRALAATETGVVAGTRGGQILELSGEAGRLVLSAHYDRELWAVTGLPKTEDFVSVGEDGFLARWNGTKPGLRVGSKLKFAGTAIEASSDGRKVFVGTESGFVLRVNSESMEVEAKLRVSQKRVSILRSSADGRWLAVGAHDAKIYMVDSAALTMTFALRGHHSAITALDFSEDGEFLQSTCTGCEILYWNLRDRKQETKSSQFRDSKWQTWTLPFGWPVQGIFPPCSDATDINSVWADRRRSLLFTADDFGRVNAFRWPALKGAASIKFVGHSSHVTAIRLLPGETRAVSAGGNDKSLFVWTLEAGGAEPPAFDESGVDVGDFLAPPPAVSAEPSSALIAQEDDFYTASKAWVGDLIASTPAEFKNAGGRVSAPEQKLFLSHVFGYRCFDARQSAALIPGGNVAFAAAALGVVLDPKHNTQTFFNKHVEDVVSFTLNPTRKIAATGQMAAKGAAKAIDLYVWDLESKEVLANLKGFHLRAVQLLRFSPDGNRLLSFGQDDDNSLALHDWKTSRLLTTAKTDKKNVLDAAWAGDSAFYSAGTRHLKHWTFAGASVKGKQLSWGSVTPEAVVALAASATAGFAGTASGKLLQLAGASVRTAVAAHKDSVLVLFLSSDRGRLYSGGKDGAVIEWQVSGAALSLTRKIVSGASLDTLDPAIRVIDVLGDSLLVGSRGGDLFVVADPWTPGKSAPPGKSQRVLSGHYGGELWGLSSHPQAREFATCGDEGMIARWDADSRTLLARKDFKEKLRAIDYSPDGESLAVVAKGAVVLLDKSLNELSRAKTPFEKPVEWSEELKFSPAGDFLATGAHGGVSPLLVFSVKDRRLSAFASIRPGITSALLHLDWSVDGGMVMLNSQAYELKFVNVAGKSVARASAAATVDWATWTCKIGWAAQGVNPGIDGTEINTVARSNNKTLMASGEDSQLVKLFAFPVYQPKAPCKSYIAHSSHVTRVRWACDDKLLYSIGGNDKTAMIWHVLGEDEDPPTPSGQQALPSSSSPSVPDDEDDYDGDFPCEKTAKNKFDQQEESPFVPDDGMEMVEDDGQDFFMAVKPWLGAIFPPSDFNTATKTREVPPPTRVELEYVHGFRSKDCRNQVKFIDGRLIYFAAALVVSLDPETNTQKFLRGHRDDVTAMAVSADGRWGASGEVGPKPLIMVWSTSDLSLQKELKGGPIKGIACLGFSPSGKSLAGACIDDDHTVFLFNIETGKADFVAKGGKDVITSLAFYSETAFSTAGIKTFKVWSGGKDTKGSFGKHDPSLLSAALLNGQVLTGNSKGCLLAWSAGSVTKSVQLDAGKPLESVAVCASRDGSSMIAAGGNAGIVHFLGPDLSPKGKISLKELLGGAQSCRIRSLAFSPDLSALYVGTFGSEIYRLAGSGGPIYEASEKSLKATQLLSGHFAPSAKWTNEVWALVSLSGGDFLTGGDDGTLRHWSAANRRLIRLASMNIDKSGGQLPPNPETGELCDAAKVRTLAVCAEQKHIAVGCKDATLRVLLFENLRQILLVRHRKKWISALKYSPDNKWLAVGSHDSIIDLYAVDKGYKRIYSLNKHHSFITQLDWSVDSSFLHSNSGDYELLFWDASSGKQLTRGGSSLRNEDWATWTCVLGWPVQGVFKAEWDGSDVNAVARSTQCIADGARLLAAADDFGEIRLYKYPCLEKSNEGVRLSGHSSHVTNVVFNDSDSYLFSTGGEDQTVMQWKILG